MKITNIEEYIGTAMTKDVLKKSMGDSPEFDIVYEALMKNAKSEELDVENKEKEYNYIGTGVGQKLDDIPMRFRTETSEGLSNNIGSKPEKLKWDFEDYKEVSKVKDVEETIDENELWNDGTRINSAVDKYSKEYGVDKKLVLAIIKQESNFNSNAVSSAGATGLMQLMDFNVLDYGITDPFDIEQNIEGGVRHIKGYLNMFNGDVEMALMAYNGGQGTMERRGVESSNDLYKMPKETQNYVPKVMNYYKNGI